MFDFPEDNTMDINTKIGSKVRFSFPENGITSDVEKAKKYLKENEIYISTFGIVQCIDVYLRTLFFCNTAKDKFDIMESINKHFVVSHSYKSIEEFRQNFNDGMCAFSQEEAFHIMLTAINERINHSRRLLLKDFNEVINNVSTIFDLISKYIDDIFTLLNQEIDEDTHGVHFDITIGDIRISMYMIKDEANQHKLYIDSLDYIY